MGFFDSLGKAAVGTVTGLASGFVTGGPGGAVAGALAGAGNAAYNWNKGSFSYGDAAKGGGIFGGASGFGFGVAKSAGAFESFSANTLKTQGVGGALAKSFATVKIPAAAKSAGLAGLAVQGGSAVIRSLSKAGPAIADAGGKAGETALQIINAPPQETVQQPVVLQPPVQEAGISPVVLLGAGGLLLFILTRES